MAASVMTSRRRLPNRRQSYSADFWHGRDEKNGRLGHRYHASASIYAIDGEFEWGEVFLSAYAEGPTAAYARDQAILASIATQYGAPIAEIKKTLTKTTLRDSGEKVEAGASDEEFFVSPIGAFLEILEGWRAEFLGEVAAHG